MVLLTTNVLVQLLDVGCNGLVPPGADHLLLLISASTYLVDGVLKILVVNFADASHGNVSGHALS